MILFHKMLRDMRYHRAQFIAIFLMIFLGVLIYAGVNSEWNGLKQYSESFYKETKMADTWIFGTDFSKQDVARMKEQPGIVDVERRAILPVSMVQKENKKITLNILESHTISKMKLMDGIAYDDSIDGVWINEQFAKANHLQINDTLKIEYGSFILKKQIRGIILHPEYVYTASETDILPDYENQGYAFISQHHVPAGVAIPYTQLLIKEENKTQREQAVSTVFHNQNLSVVERKDLPSYKVLADEIIQHQAFGNIFPIVFLLIAVLTTLTTVSKMILHQRMQIGILKAVGFTNRKVLFHYVSHILCITTVAAVTAFIIGPLIVPNMLYPMMETIYALPELKGVPYDYSFYLVIGSVFLCFSAAFIICRKQLKENAADTLKPQIRKDKHSSFLVKTNVWKKLNFYAQWNIRDILRNKTRSIMAVIGIAGCMGLLFCAFGLQDTFHNLIDTIYGEQQQYTMRVDLKNESDIDDIKKAMKGNAIKESGIVVKVGDSQERGSLLVQETTKYLNLLQDNTYETVELPKNGVAISRVLAEKLQVKKGEQIVWREESDQTWHKAIIQEILYTPTMQGLTMSKSFYEQSGYTFQATAIVGEKADMSNFTNIKSVQYLTDLKDSMNVMMDGMNLMIVILMCGAVILGVVVLYNIGTFSYIEKIREMATLKVLGFRDIQVRKLLRQQNLWLTICGILLGIPFGYYLIYIVISTAGEAADYRITITLFTTLLCCLGTLFISTLVIWFVSLRVSKIDMVEALKAIE